MTAPGKDLILLSLTDIAECQLENVETTTKEVYLQLLQLNEFDYTEVFQCKIDVDRTIYYCGMHSHISDVHNGRREHISETNFGSCRRLIETRTILLGNNVLISGIRPNTISSHSATLADTIGIDGRCMGTQYLDPYGMWDNVIVQAAIKIITKKFQIPNTPRTRSPTIRRTL